MVQQTIQFETVSPSEIGSGTITAFLYSGDTLAATLANITENSTLKGRHTGTVDDKAAADYRLVVKFDGYTVSEPDETVTLLLAVGTYVSKRLAVLDSATQTQITNIETLVEALPANVTVLPATGIVANRSASVTLTPVVGETISQAITVYQSDGTTAVNLSGKTLRIVFETMSGTDVTVVQAADITISGTNSNVVTFAYPAAVTALERTLRFAIRDAAAPLTMYLQGVCSVGRAPQVDA
jgi:hypothetical protein